MRTRPTLSSRWASLSESGLRAEAPFVRNDEVYSNDMEMVYGSPCGQWAFLEVAEQALLD